jgi:hypothetical protein
VAACAEDTEPTSAVTTAPTSARRRRTRNFIDRTPLVADCSPTRSRSKGRMVDQGDHERDAANMIAARRNLATPRSEINAAFHHVHDLCRLQRDLGAWPRADASVSRTALESRLRGALDHRPRRTRAVSVRESAPPRANERRRRRVKHAGPAGPCSSAYRISHTRPRSRPRQGA